MTDENLKPCARLRELIGTHIQNDCARYHALKQLDALTRAQEPTGDAVEALKEHLSKSCNDSFGKVRNGLDERLNRSDAISALEDIAIYLNRTRNLCNAALQTPAAGNAPEGVDVEALKKPNEYIPTTKRERDLSNYGYNKAINYLAAQGLLAGKIPSGDELLERFCKEHDNEDYPFKGEDYDMGLLKFAFDWIAAAPSTNKEETK